MEQAKEKTPLAQIEADAAKARAFAEVKAVRVNAESNERVALARVQAQEVEDRRSCKDGGNNDYHEYYDEAAKAEDSAA